AVGEEVAERGAGRFLGPLVGVGLFVAEMIFPDSVDSGEYVKGNVPRFAAKPEQRQSTIESARKNSKTVRREWEKTKGKKWPKNKDGKNYDADHKKALADGGSNSPRNIQPRTHKDHIDRHKKNGDFKRWGKRAHRKRD